MRHPRLRIPLVHWRTKTLPLPLVCAVRHCSLAANCCTITIAALRCCNSADAAFNAALLLEKGDTLEHFAAAAGVQAGSKLMIMLLTPELEGYTLLPEFLICIDIVCPVHPTLIYIPMDGLHTLHACYS